MSSLLESLEGQQVFRGKTARLRPLPDAGKVDIRLILDSFGPCPEFVSLGRGHQFS